MCGEHRSHRPSILNVRASKCWPDSLYNYDESHIKTSLANIRYHKPDRAMNSRPLRCGDLPRRPPSSADRLPLLNVLFDFNFDLVLNFLPLFLPRVGFSMHIPQLYSRLLCALHLIGQQLTNTHSPTALLVFVDI